VDISIACAFMILQAYELCLGTCWIGAFREDEAKRILMSPEDVLVVAMTPLGYPNELFSQESRKGLDQIVCFEKYG
jgi:nitroreductase